jgi:hypothetical protein
MAIFLSNTIYFKIGTYDLSGRVTSASFDINYDQLDVSAMGAVSHSYSKGLASHSLTISFLNDSAAIAANSVERVINSLKGTAAAFEIANNGSTSSGTNPIYSGSCFVNNYTPVNGDVASMSTIDVTWDLTTDITIT